MNERTNYVPKYLFIGRNVDFYLIFFPSLTLAAVASVVCNFFLHFSSKFLFFYGILNGRHVLAPCLLIHAIK